MCRKTRGGSGHTGISACHKLCPPRAPQNRKSQHLPSVPHQPRVCRCPCLFPGAPPTPAPHDPRDTHLSRRTTPSMHAPKSTTELISARRSRRAGGMQRVPQPSSGPRGPLSRPGAPPSARPVQQGARPPPAPASSEGYRPRRWWQWPGWCPWGWTSGRPAGPRSGWSRP